MSESITKPTGPKRLTRFALCIRNICTQCTLDIVFFRRSCSRVIVKTCLWVEGDLVDAPYSDSDTTEKNRQKMYSRPLLRRLGEF